MKWIEWMNKCKLVYNLQSYIYHTYFDESIFHVSYKHVSIIYEYCFIFHAYDIHKTQYNRQDRDTYTQTVHITTLIQWICICIKVNHWHVCNLLCHCSTLNNLFKHLSFLFFAVHRKQDTTIVLIEHYTLYVVRSYQLISKYLHFVFAYASVLLFIVIAIVAKSRSCSSILHHTFSFIKLEKDQKLILLVFKNHLNCTNINIVIF